MHQHVVDKIGVEVVSGSPPDGQTLEPEHILAERLSVSRGAIREAVKALAAKGMVELRPRTGTRVLPRSRWNLLDHKVLSWMEQTDPESLTVHLTEVRRLIEPGAAALAAERATTNETDALTAAYQAMEQAHREGHRDSFTAADIRFHHELLRLTNNPLLISLSSSLEVALRAAFETTSAAPGGIETTLPLHFQVADAVVNHQPALARSQMEVLIDTSARNFADVRKLQRDGRTLPGSPPLLGQLRRALPTDQQE
jgi:DNA-binding FadR family transcriptional regulator